MRKTPPDVGGTIVGGIVFVTINLYVKQSPKAKGKKREEAKLF